MLKKKYGQEIKKLAYKSLNNRRFVFIFAANNTQSSPATHNLQCTNSPPLEGVTLRGGLKSGNFTDVGTADDISACSRLCCVSEKCDLAMVLRGHCFLVACFTKELCETVKTHTKNYRPTVAYVRRWITNATQEAGRFLSCRSTEFGCSCITVYHCILMPEKSVNNDRSFDSRQEWSLYVMGHYSRKKTQYTIDTYARGSRAYTGKVLMGDGSLYTGEVLRGDGSLYTVEVFMSDRSLYTVELLMGDGSLYTGGTHL